MSSSMASSQPSEQQRPMTRGGTAITAFSAPTSYEVEEDDGDEGMFSYLPPSTSHGGPSARPGTLSASQPAPAALQPAPAALTRVNSVPTSSSLSPAAAYAQSQVVELGNGAVGVKRRSGYAYPESPGAHDVPLSDPYAPQMQTEELHNGYSVSRHSPAAPPTGTPIIELNDRIKRASMRGAAQSSSASVASDKGLDPKDLGIEAYYDGSMRPPDTSATLAYANALRDLNGMDGEEEDSPYPEVRASVSNIDDPEMPCLTIRAWILGILFCSLCGALNLFFQLRYPSPFITPILIQILSYPAGKIAANILPTRIFNNPSWMQRVGFPDEWSFNPGPFNIKEHTIIIIMANAAIAPAYALNLTLTLDKYYNLPKGPGFDILLCLSTQMLGFGLAGICRRFLVWPAGMIWPQNLVLCTLLNTFHAEDDDGSDGSMTRYRFFTWVFCLAGAWYLLPNFLFSALSWFSWVCWIAPNNVVVNQLFGVVTGLGMSAITFDWGQIAYIGSPLIVPWWAEVNVFVGFVFFFWFLTPILYYKNFWNFAYMPISSGEIYDRFGAPYNVSAVITPDSSQLDVTAYQGYSPLFLGATYVATYSIALALSTAILVHTALYYGKSIVQKLKNVRTEAEDVHAKLMRNYPEVPDWWYWAFGSVFLLLGIIANEVWSTGLPIWAMLLSILLATIYVLPGGFIYAMTSQEITINLIAELIPGYLLPGRPIAVMVFKTFSAQSLFSGLSFVQDLKLGHYMKVPPRSTWIVQVVATFVSVMIQVGVKYWMMSAIPDLCSGDQNDHFTCPQNGVFYATSIIWGLIGPDRMFSPGQMYHHMVWWALIGAVLPIPFYFLAKRWPNSWLRFVNIPVLLTGCAFIPPATGFNYSSWFFVGFIFQYLMRRRRFRWWSKFNFVLSAGLEGGTIIAGVLIFFCLFLPKNGALEPTWWGNTVWQNTLDYNGTTYLTPPETGFGPETW